MNTSANNFPRRSVTNAALLSFLAAIVFAAAFQLSKSDAISSISPFADDPYDIVPSIAFQVALAGGLLALIRWLRMQGDPGFSHHRARLILRSCLLVSASIAITILTDCLAIAQVPMTNLSGSYAVLIGGLVSVAAFGLIAAAASRRAWRQLSSIAAAQPDEASNTLDDLLDDVVTLSERGAFWLRLAVRPLGRLAESAAAQARRMLTWLNTTWISPRAHPWRFATACALIGGAWLALAKVIFEGPPPNLTVGLLVSAIFIGVELTAVLGSYLLFGGWLGIRPPLRVHN
jgi:hypothetical protein